MFDDRSFSSSAFSPNSWLMGLVQAVKKAFNAVRVTVFTKKVGSVSHLK